MDSHQRGNLVAARPPYSATCTSTHSRSLPFVFWVNFQPLKLFFCLIPFVRVSGSVWQMCVAVREEGEGWESKKWGWGLVWVVAGGGGYRLGGGQSKQAVIKSRIFAIIAVFILQRTASEAFFPPFLYTQGKFSHTSATLFCHCKAAESHCVHVSGFVCVLLRPWASLMPIKKRGRETNCRWTSKRWQGGT